MPLWHQPFRAKWDNQPLLHALLALPVNGGKAKSEIAIARLWECKALATSGLTESQWTELKVAERARRIVALQYPDWLAALMEKKR